MCVGEASPKRQKSQQVVLAWRDLKKAQSLHTPKEKGGEKIKNKNLNLISHPVRRRRRMLWVMFGLQFPQCLLGHAG